MDLNGAARETVGETITHLSLPRKSGAVIPEFSAVAPLLSRTDILANMVPQFLGEDVERYGLQALDPPAPLPSLKLRFFWSRHSDDDPAATWIRSIVFESYNSFVERNQMQA